MGGSVTTKPLISVLLPVFNGAPFLEQAVHSIQDQTYQNLEILIIDDGSSDGSDIIVNRLAKNDRRIVPIHKPNTGLTDTLNLGIRRARGEWIARIDQDDIAHESRLEAQLQQSKTNKRAVLVGSDFLTLDQKTGNRRSFRLPTTHYLLLQRLFRMQRFFPHSSAFFSTAVARQVGGYDLRALYNEDWDLWLRLSAVGEITSVSQRLMTIRKHDSQMTRNSGPIVPIGEAFVSSVIHLMKLKCPTECEKIHEIRNEIRDMIHETPEYKQFCYTTRLQDEWRSSISTSKSKVELAAYALRTLRGTQHIRDLALYQICGTSRPAKVASSLASTSRLCQ